LPFFLNYGWNPDIHFDVENNSTEKGVPAACKQAETLKLKQEELQTQWRTAIKAQTESYDQKRKAQQYNMRDEVLLSTKNLKAKQPSRKLTHCFIGPYCVEKIISR